MGEISSTFKQNLHYMAMSKDWYKFIISFSIFNRMGLWRTLCLQSNFEEVLCVSFSIPIFPFHFSKRFLWFHSNSLSISSSNSFWDLFFLTSRQCIRSLWITYSFTYST